MTPLTPDRRSWLVLGLIGMRILLADAAYAERFKTGVLRDATGMQDLQSSGVTLTSYVSELGLHVDHLIR